jgi:hypothetical protein
VLDDCIGAREEEAFVTVVVPTYEERWTAVIPSHLQDLGVPIGLAHVMTLDHQSISDFCMHGVAPR